MVRKSKIYDFSPSEQVMQLQCTQQKKKLKFQFQDMEAK